MDLISNLPKHILYEILSMMPEKDAARTSILSKTWRETWSNSPILIFKVPRNAKKNRYLDENDQKQIQVMRERNYFLNHVNSTIQKFHDQGLAIKHFNLYLDYSDPHSLSPLIDHWIELLVMNNDLKVFHFSLIRLIYSNSEFYCLPHNFLESKSLLRLILHGCIKLEKSLFLNHPIKFTSLKVLSLSFVTLEEEQIIWNLFSSCPLIEDVTLKNCTGLKSVSIKTLPNLRKVELVGIQEVNVDAPNLEYFHYFVGVNSISCKVNLDKCISLRDLCLSFKGHVIITSQWLIELLQKFPLLERLELEDCNISEKMQISTMQLKVLKFTKCSMLEEAFIDAPKLDSFGFHCCDLTMPTKVSFSNNLDSLEFNVRVDIAFELDFMKLREFLQNIKPSSVLVSLVLKFDYLTDEFNPYVLQGLSDPPPCIKHLQIEYFSNLETLCSPFPFALFWTCHPSIMSIMMNSTLCSRRIVKLFCEMLMGEDDCCFNSCHTKCWWHDLKDVEVTRSSSKMDNVVVDCKTLLDALPILLTKEEVRFRLGP